jgi:hypothetical protein
MNRFLIAAALLLLSSQVWAGIYIEPYVGYEAGTQKGTIVAGGTTTVDEKDIGTNFGGKLGWSLMGFGFGADYMTSSLTGKDQNTNPQPDLKWTPKDIGVFAQFSLLKLFKVSATYFLSSKSHESTNGVDAKGKGFKVGVGFMTFPFISLNIDMINIKYDDATMTGSTVTSTDVTRKTILVSLSVPLGA